MSDLVKVYNGIEELNSILTITRKSVNENTDLEFIREQKLDMNHLYKTLKRSDFIDNVIYAYENAEHISNNRMRGLASLNKVLSKDPLSINESLSLIDNCDKFYNISLKYDGNAKSSLRDMYEYGTNLQHCLMLSVSINETLESKNIEGFELYTNMLVNEAHRICEVLKHSVCGDNTLDFYSCQSEASSYTYINEAVTAIAIGVAAAAFLKVIKGMNDKIKKLDMKPEPVKEKIVESKDKMSPDFLKGKAIFDEEKTDSDAPRLTLSYYDKDMHIIGRMYNIINDFVSVSPSFSKVTNIEDLISNSDKYISEGQKEKSFVTREELLKKLELKDDEKLSVRELIMNKLSENKKGIVGKVSVDFMITEYATNKLVPYLGKATALTNRVESYAKRINTDINNLKDRADRFDRAVASTNKQKEAGNNTEANKDATNTSNSATKKDGSSSSTNFNNSDAKSDNSATYIFEADETSNTVSAINNITKDFRDSLNLMTVVLQTLNTVVFTSSRELSDYAYRLSEYELNNKVSSNDTNNKDNNEDEESNSPDKKDSKSLADNNKKPGLKDRIKGLFNKKDNVLNEK